ncbi:MAG: alpha-ribazole phosphatase [Desulfuromonadaceae bacterium]|nr:alpha-ribazole phosphatase [Desulfuromonadaceae bacterium]MDD2854209.1 alpha-ribazole phosphatase [Desulfuromonadaceae bacterium]
MTSHTRIYLVRHGQVVGFDQPRYNGQTDVALTDYGIFQYQQLKERLISKQISACYTSDLTRCVTGAAIISDALGLKPVQRSELRELNIGIWEGMAWDEIKSIYPEGWQARLEDLVNYRVPKGESLNDVEARVMPVINEVVEKHSGKEVLIVAHGGVNRIVLLNAINAPLAGMFNIEQSYGCLNIIDYYTDGRATVKLLNG